MVSKCTEQAVCVDSKLIWRVFFQSAMDVANQKTQIGTQMQTTAAPRSKLFKTFPICFLFASSITFAEQLKLLPSKQQVASGDVALIELIYEGGVSASGLGVRIHFDSRALMLEEITSVLRRDLVGVQEPTADTADLDGDAQTDMYVLAAWADITNDGWLISNSESLIVLQFKTHGDGPTRIGISSNDRSKSLSLEGSSAQISF